MDRCTRVAALGAGDSIAHLLGRLPDHSLDVIAADARALNEPRYDLFHICGPAPAISEALLAARRDDAPVVASFHPSLSGALYHRCAAVLSPGRAADQLLDQAGVSPARICRWEPGVDPLEYRTATREPAPATFRVLYVGPARREHGIELLIESFLIARDRDPRLQLVVAGSGPEKTLMRARLRAAATFETPSDRAGLYASADLFVFPTTAEPFGQAILEAQASGLPVIAVQCTRASELIESGRSGCLVPPDPEAFASAIRVLAGRARLRARLASGGLLAVSEHSLERSLRQLADAYALALGHLSSPLARSRAA